MMHTIYRPGQWNTLVAPGALVALPSDASEALVATLWERLNAERTLAVVVDAITDSVGGSFSAMPPFIAVVVEGANARVALRGDITADVTGTDGVQSLTGADVLTWNERFIPGATRIVLRLDDAAGAPELPVIGGVIRAAEVIADVEPSDAESTTSTVGGAVPDAEAEDAAPADAPSSEGSPTDDASTESALDAQAADALLPDAAAVAAPVAEPPTPTSEDLAWSPIDADADADAAEPQESETSAEAAESAPDAATEAIAVDAPADEPEPSGASEAEVSGLEASEAEASGPAAPEQEPHPADGISGETLVPAEQTLGSDFDEFEQLFGDTVHSVPSTPPAAPIEGDHDGATISVAEARALRRDLPPVPQLEPEAPTALLPTVGGGRIRVSTGQVVDLDRTVVIGRRPRAPRASGASLPHLIAVESPQQDISRSHLEVRPEGDTVVVIDLHTTNGSTLLRPGADPVRLHPGEQTLVLTGDVIDLGDGVTVAFEDLP